MCQVLSALRKVQLSVCTQCRAVSMQPLKRTPAVPRKLSPAWSFLSVFKSVQHGETEPALLRVREIVLVNIVNHFDSQIPSILN